jgi:membrane-bound metal-dependent hydrolase YbcI (DUF457 family)
MYAGHFAAGLALRGRARRVPVTALLAGAFLLDFLWILFGVFHLDHTAWDDWSHSFVMSAVWATAFAAFFWRLGRRAFIVAWLAVFSHYVLDLIVQGASLYPNEPMRLLIPILVADHYRLFQLLLCIVLLAIFGCDERRSSLPAWRAWAVCCLVLVLNLRFLLGM